MEVRCARRGDVGDIVAMSCRLFAEDGGVRDEYMDVRWPERKGAGYFGDVVGDDQSLCLVAEDGGRGIGYLVGRLRFGDSLRPVTVAVLESMYVVESERGRGTGAALVGGFFEWAGRRRAEVTSVTAYASNQGALRFYRKHGFVDANATLERRK